MQVAVPLYTWPAPVSDAWEAVLAAPPAVGFVVLNPESGPSTCPVESFQTAVKACQEAGIGVLGYTRSIYAAREAKDVLEDFEKYLQWYGVDGLFVDEVTCGQEYVEYYQQLSLSIRQVLGSHTRSRLGPSLVFNPGTSVIEEYMPLADVLVTFEGPAAAYDDFLPSEYVWQYPAGKFWHIIHDVAQSESEDLLHQVQQKHVSWVYVTDLGLPNPYNALPEARIWSLETGTQALQTSDT